jgi:hypothetical protein
MHAHQTRYTDEQLGLAKSYLQTTTESVALAFWTEQERFAGSIEGSLRHACEALGFRLVPSNNEGRPVTE